MKTLKNPMTKYNKLMDRAEYNIILTALIDNRWCQREVAKELGIHELSVHNKMQKHGLLKSQRSINVDKAHNIGQTL